MGKKYKFDCMHFRGYKPCAKKRACEGCDEHAPWSHKILIIKLGALGDVLRTTPVLHAFKRKYPHAQVTWITKRSAKEMLETTPLIHRLIYVDDPDHGAILRLLVEEFDEVHCYDKEDSAIALATLVKAKKKFGFAMNREGQMMPVNLKAEYSFDLGLSDELKFQKNKKTYQELCYETSGLKIPKKMDPYEIVLTSQDHERAKKELLKYKNKLLIGLNTGSGRVFLTKQWPEEQFLELAKTLSQNLSAHILLLGGKDEEEKNKRLSTKLNGIATYLGSDFSIREFTAILKNCDAVVTGDTLAMHLSLAVKTPTVALFGSTCEQEVDMYSTGQKLVGKASCSPCYKNTCDQKDFMACMKSITVFHVFKAVCKLVEREDDAKEAA